jgi:pyruvate-ferredoxin/flavodoxin oxidoreductase
MISDEKVLDYYVGLEFARKHSLYPKQEILLQEIVSNYPEIEKISVGGNDVLPGISTLKPVEMPLALRKIKDKGPKYSQLSRYNDQTAFLYAKGEQNNLVADPYSALALVPQAGSALFNSKDAKETLPILDVSKCTGCGDCISVCPQLAIRPVVSSVESLMQTGMSLVASKGVNITRLTPMLKNMGKLAGSVFAESAGTDAAELLTDVFNNLCNQMKISGDSLTPLKAEFALVLEEIGEMPVALTDSFYFEQNAIEKGRGELFSLAIDPDLCTSCELCSSNCEEKALQMLSRDETILAKAKKQNKLWENMPDVLPDTIERLFQEKEYSKASALLLSRNYANTLVGVNENRKTDPVKQMMHLITASAESVVQPKLVNQIKQVDELLQKLSDQAHKMLNEAIPNDSLELLNEAIAETHDRKLSFKQIFEKFRDEGHGKLIDREDMQRKLALIDSLKRLKGMLSEGPSGLGRSRFGLMIDGTELFDWASTYPMNPFLNPTVIQRSGDIAEQAMGLFYGQLRYILDNIKLIRRANLEISNKYNPSLHDKLIANLSWEDLSDDEKNAIPPILLIVDHRQIIENAWSGLFNLLSGNFPLKIFALNTLHFDINNPRVDYDRMNASIWSIIGLKRVFVYQGSLANMDGLCSSVMIGLNRVDPAFFHLYVSDPELHASKKVNWLPFADLANSSRSFPEITFDPHHHKSFLHEAIEIDKNPEVRDNWTRTGLPGEDDEIIEYKISWADWIFTYKSWQKEFKQSDYQENFIPVAEYLELETAQKSDRSPVIIRRGKEGLNYYKVSDKVVQMTREVLNNWRSLQEFAGYISPFAEKLRKELNAQSEKEFEDKIAMLKKSHEEELNNLEAEHLEKIREQLKQKLVTLSKMAKN